MRPDARPPVRDLVPPLDAWVAAAVRTVWLPVPFARYAVTPAEAATMLRVPETLVARLVDAGLPAADGRVDAHDVFNLALELGWSGSMPVIGFRGALRWLQSPVGELLAPRVWECAFGLPDTEAGPVAVARPFPEAYGGRWVDDPSSEPAGDGPAGRVVLGPGRSIRGRALLSGAHRPVRDPVVRTLVTDVLDSGLRWGKLPFAFQLRADEMAALGYGTCVSVSATLVAQLRARGYTARSRRGTLVAPVATAHTWVEIAGDDGWTVVDPVLVLLRRRLDALDPPGADAPDPAVLADGLLVDRVLPFAVDGDEPLATDPAGRPVELVASYRRIQNQELVAP